MVLRADALRAFFRVPFLREAFFLRVAFLRPPAFLREAFLRVALRFGAAFFAARFGAAFFARFLTAMCVESSFLWLRDVARVVAYLIQYYRTQCKF